MPRLLEVTANPASLGLNADWNKTAWGREVWHAARAAYERACPHETSRQIRAHASGTAGVGIAAPASDGPKDHTETEKEDEA